MSNWATFNNNGNSHNRTHNMLNAITTVGSQNVTYDFNGNQLNFISKNYYWDKLNRLTEVRNVSSNALIAKYYYNAENIRGQKTTLTSIEQYYYSDGRISVETDGLQNIKKEYIHGTQYLDEIIATKSGGMIAFYLYDKFFSVYALVDLFGNLLDRFRYQCYGQQELLTSTFNPNIVPLFDQTYGFTGQRIDTETGLQYFRLRYFDNFLGRFISRDPIGYEGGLNLYNGYFVGNGMDPYGLMSLSDRIKSWSDDLKDNASRLYNEIGRNIEGFGTGIRDAFPGFMMYFANTLNFANVGGLIFLIVDFAVTYSKVVFNKWGSGIEGASIHSEGFNLTVHRSIINKAFFHGGPTGHTVGNFTTYDDDAGRGGVNEWKLLSPGIGYFDFESFEKYLKHKPWIDSIGNCHSDNEASLNGRKFYVNLAEHEAEHAQQSLTWMVGSTANSRFEDEADYKALYYFNDYSKSKLDRVKVVTHRNFDGKVDTQICP